MKIVIITGYDTSEIVQQAMKSDMQGSKFASDNLQRTKTAKLLAAVSNFLKKEHYYGQ